MLTVTSEFFEACKDKEREVFTRVIINNKTIYFKDSIKMIDYSMGALGGERFQIGSTQSATLKIVFSEIIENFKELDEIKVEIGFKIRGTGLPSNINNVSKVNRARVGRARLVSYVADRYEFVPLGTFYVSGRVDPDRNEKTTTVEARDGFIFMESTYESNLNFPAKLSDVALEIANKSGAVIDPISFNHLSNYSINNPTGYTFRQAIGLIGQFEGGFACFDREGKLAIRTLSDPNFKIDPNEYFLKGLTKNELLYQPRGLSCKVVNPTEGSSNETTILQSGSKNGAQISLENNVMTQTLLDDIFQKIRYINFFPINVKWRGNPAIEVGDWVTLTDREGKNFKSPVLNYSMTFDGGFSSVISADSKAYSSNVSSFKGPLQQKLDDMDYRIDAAGKNNVYEGTEEPQNPKEGDIWFKKNGPDDEIWVYKQTSPGVFEWVMTTSTALEESIKKQIEDSTPKDEIVKTINLSTEMDGKEWLKIKGAKLWLTNETKIDKAIITSAMIGSVDAGTISVGTLDASKIRVINLDASSISTGILNAITIKGATISGSKITSTGIDYNMTLDNGAIRWNRNSDGKKVFEIYSAIRNQNEGVMYFTVEDGGTFNLKSNKLGRNFITAYGSTSTMQLNFDLDRLSLYSSKGNTLSFSVERTGFSYSANDSGTYRNLYLRSNAFRADIGGNKYLYLTNTGFSINTEGIMNFMTNNSIQLRGTSCRITSDASVDKSFYVYGTKSSIVRTENYGERLLYAYETPEYLFATYGKAITNDDGYAEVDIENIFLETINTDSKNYHVFVSPYENANVHACYLEHDRFMVKSDKPNIKFSWQIVAYRKGYEEFYLETLSSNNDKAPKLLQYPISMTDMTERNSNQILNYEKVN
ncbi:MULTISPECIES: hypothetical protein [unclassified Enterococcus]|uniref:hypothetical protein n=1 Tax=unclassified Enterococcus TaxID=2608891 RepID=UPI000A32D9E3|nr:MULTISPECIES: hypothetical protein [unclassified Enterococcus]OTO77267.1 hypothetical protein A5865_001142 [Enterococcus sp. 12E11_DIV0728]OUZ16572.1 hypothetical protein A5868_001494 [Enterococcus sp. 12F9_DIV0723]